MPRCHLLRLIHEPQDPLDLNQLRGIGLQLQGQAQLEGASNLGPLADLDAFDRSFFEPVGIQDGLPARQWLLGAGSPR